MCFFRFFLANNVNKDVFEAFYLKRTSKSSHSSKSSNDSFRGTEETTPTHAKTQSYFGGDGKSANNKVAKYGQSDKFGSGRFEKPRPQQQYLFGASYDRASSRADEPEKENIYKNINDKSPDRFKTITINSLRRSFRDSFLDSAKPSKGREHQPLWFIDVKSDAAKKNDAIKSNKAGWQSSDRDGISNERTRSPVKRNETFRVDKEDAPAINDGPRSNGISRKETFRVHDRYLEPRRRRSPSIESNHSYTTSIRVDSKNPVNDRSGKMVPIAVTAPYSALNDSDTYSGRSPKRISQNTNEFDRHSVRNENYSPIGSDKFNDTPSNLNDHYRSYDIPNSVDHSPVRYNRTDNYSPSRTSPKKTLIEIKSLDNDRYTSNRNDEDPFESRALPERQSFRDFNDDIIRPRTHRSYASLRSKLEQTAFNGNRYRPHSSMNSYTYDDVDGPDGKPGYSTPRNHQTESWRSISSRRFSKDGVEDTENRSFVPYRSSNSSRYGQYQPENDIKSNNCNRTTININYNYNLSPKENNGTPSNSFTGNGNSNTFTRPSAVNKSTSAIKSNQANKEKPSKNRSVNFPSVECEVRLISPNYETKPRRKDSWKAKTTPNHDWTFNKVHF